MPEIKPRIQSRDGYGTQKQLLEKTSKLTELMEEKHKHTEHVDTKWTEVVLRNTKVEPLIIAPKNKKVLSQRMF